MATVEGRIVRYANPAFCRLIGREDVAGNSFREILPADDASVTMLDRVLRTGKPESHTQQESKSHSVFWSYAMWPLIVDKRPVAVIVQVTETAQSHDKTRQMNEALLLGAVRQHELAAVANASKVQALAADVLKNEFLAMLAHELRNPLAPISYMIEVLKRADGKADLIKPALGTIERQVRQMTRLIDDLLDVSRITRDKLELRLEDVDLASVIETAVEASRALCEAAKLDLTVTLPPQPVHLHADPARLAQVFGNILHNACKFTRPGGRISLAAQVQADKVVVTVRDSGVGIPFDMLTNIFEMFTQGDQTLERTTGGLGIGLTLVRRLVKLHGGSVQAFSAGIEQGSEFVVCLPMAHMPAALPVTSVAGELIPVSAQRILVVDDNRETAHALSSLLELSGNQTFLAYDGAQAVEAAARLRPDVVLMDIGMPKVNGYSAARRIREHAWGKAMTLVAVTGWGQIEDRQKTAAAGFDGHLVKPVEYADLATMLARCQLRKAGQSRQQRKTNEPPM
jgi:signal transduction histidine kinase/ActR/RegA family two-component response regulator